MSGQSIDEKTPEFEGIGFVSPSNKRKTEMSIDRLSALPDGILIHILSFLGGVEESAVTSILSKRWRFIWTELPILRLREYSKKSEKIRQFVAKVHKTLLMRSTTRLEEFEVSFRYDESFASDVDSWVDFVLKHKVKKVGFRLLPPKKDEDEEEEEDLYALPETMYSNSSLTQFSMEGCDLDTLTKIEWPFLTSLYIVNSELPQHVVDNILSGCPVLHTLNLKDCWGFNCLDVKSRNLFKLKVHDREDGENGPLLEISAPYVHTLDISFDTDGRKLVLTNIKSLVRAHIDFTEYWPRFEEVPRNTKELFEIILHVKELYLGRHYFQALSELVVINGWQLPISTRKCLTINTISEDERNISGIFALLKFSPNLEMLDIEGFVSGEETLGEAAPDDLNCDLLSLKTVKISDFADPAFGGEPMLSVARSILTRATVLEEMMVKLRVKEIDDYIKIGQTLLSFPRSSREAHILLRP